MKTQKTQTAGKAGTSDQGQPTLADIYKEMNEHSHQRELFSWAAAVALVGLAKATLWAAEHPLTMKRPTLSVCGQEGDDRLRWMHSIPNGGSRGGDKAGRAIQGARMRAEGVKVGIADIFLPYPANGYHGLYIELKKIGGKADKNQKEFAQYCEKVGFRFFFSIGYYPAIREISAYLVGG